MNRHTIWMIIGCLLPLLLIFILPLFGVTGNYTIFIFIVVMFLCHITMMRGHQSHQGHEHSDQNQKEVSHESH